MRKIILFLSIFVVATSCKKAQIQPTQILTTSIPWADSSSKHPKNIAFKALLEKYHQKGLPGISLLVNDINGTWLGAVGKADIEKNIPFEIGQLSKVASITKLFIGALVFKLMEDSTNSGLGYKGLDTKLTNWLPNSITGKLANGNEITLGQCMKHETGVPDVIEQDAFYLAVLNDPNKVWKPEELLEF